MGDGIWSGDKNKLLKQEPGQVMKSIFSSTACQSLVVGKIAQVLLGSWSCAALVTVIVRLNEENVAEQDYFYHYCRCCNVK